MKTAIILRSMKVTTGPKRASLFLAAIAGLTAILFAQTPTTLRLDVRLVNVVATVTDAEGNFVSNLSANDFTVEEDGVPQKVAHFTQDRDIPVSVGILLDTSGSMDRKIRTATAAVNRSSAVSTKTTTSS